MMRLPNVIRKEVSATQLLWKYTPADSYVLNLGSGNIRISENSVGIDIQERKEVDVIGDAHKLPFASGTFDACVAVAVFQHFKNPFTVVSEIRRVLKDGGVAVVDAPFVQQYCRDTPDLFRYTKLGLENMFSDGFEVLETHVSIAAGSALAFYGQGLAGYVSGNRLLRGAAVFGTSVLLYPLRYLRFGRHHEVAGAHMLVARKKRVN